MLARLFEAVVWYETGTFASQLVDPVTLSYKKLKTILEHRGLGYSGLVEKKDVSELVEKSGEEPDGLFSVYSIFMRLLHRRCYDVMLVPPTIYGFMKAGVSSKMRV